MKKSLAVLMVIMLVGVVALAAEVPALAPTDAQMTKLQLAQKDAIIAHQQYQHLQTQQRLLEMQANQAKQSADDAIKALQTTADKVKQENKWAADTGFDMQSLKFTPAPPSAK